MVEGRGQGQVPLGSQVRPQEASASVPQQQAQGAPQVSALAALTHNDRVEIRNWISDRGGQLYQRAYRADGKAESMSNAVDQALSEFVAGQPGMAIERSERARG